MRMLRRIRWVGLVVGIAAMFLFTLLLNYSVFVMIHPYLYDTYIAEGAGVTAREDALFNALTGLSNLIATLLAFLLGGLVVGVLASAFAGLNGALSAAVAAFGGFALLVGPIVPWIWEPISNPGEVYTRADNLNNLLELSVIFCAVLPFVVLAGYVGGRLGARLRNRATSTTL